MRGKVHVSRARNYNGCFDTLPLVSEVGRASAGEGGWGVSPVNFRNETGVRVTVKKNVM